MAFGIKEPTQYPRARFEMEGVSDDPDKPHVLHVRYLGTQDPDFGESILLRGVVPEKKLPLQILIDRGDIAWENVPGESGGEPAEATKENVSAYLHMLVKYHYTTLMALIAFAFDGKNYGIVQDATALGEASPRS